MAVHRQNYVFLLVSGLTIFVVLFSEALWAARSCVGAVNLALPTRAQMVRIEAQELGMKLVEPGSEGYYREAVLDQNGHYIWTYFHLGSDLPVQQKTPLNRIASLQIPSGARDKESGEIVAIENALTDVWVAKSPRAHIQATGKDARGRTQYIYHRQWQKLSSNFKFSQLLEFARRQEKVKQQIEKDLEQRTLSKEKIIAAMLLILQTGQIRIGGESHAKNNETYGVTTFLKSQQHVSVRGDTVSFDFVGKSGKHHEIQIRNRRLAQVIRTTFRLQGDAVFQYVSPQGPRKVTASDVNLYLKEIVGNGFSVKDFRTWIGTTKAIEFLLERGPESGEKATEEVIKAATKHVSEVLHNTPAVARDNYIHPGVFEFYRQGGDFKEVPLIELKSEYYSVVEQVSLSFLQSLNR